ncbi:hypothetical protein KCH_29710 [Kitasatospora cheerisanensis KCTC 2395]|uniref:Uncharacterized protein n=1 Tax=Kitasatospora cheerisanensis KCTC 2395 TaxID=1348663 RepID=A0A066Z5D8_9ACTN|nr:hypothetical protein KCH_29710 [Kitasatospora cheerisanensis KCTC 2395]
MRRTRRTREEVHRTDQRMPSLRPGYDGRSHQLPLDLGPDGERQRSL